MPMIRLRDQQRLWQGGQEHGGMFFGGQKIWSKPAGPPAIPEISEYYGTGIGQVPIHWIMSAARLNTSDQVLNVPNQSPVATLYQANKTGTNSLFVLGDYIHAPITAPLLNFTNAIELINARLFMLINFATDSVGNLNFAGRQAGTGDGQRSNLQWVRASNTLRIIRWNGAAGPAVDLPMGTFNPLGITRLMELRILPTTMSLWMDGVHTGDIPHSFPDYILGRIMAGYSNPTFTGLMGDCVIMQDDGSPAMDPIASNIRSKLAAKYGIILP